MIAAKRQHMRMRWPASAVGLLGALACMCLVSVACGGDKPVARTMTDKEITSAVEEELIFDQAVPFYDIDVSTTRGVVMLAGSVNNLLAKDRAVALAETVKGVRSVVDRITVKPIWTRTDEQIESDAQNALLSDPATDLYEVDVSVSNNVATLTGTVDSWQEKELVAQVVKGVKGVTGIKNEISVDYKTDRVDREIRPEIESALQWDTLVDHALIDVTVDDGHVTLGGIVGSAAEKRRAEQDAWVAGVKSVNGSKLDVERWARDEDLRKNKYVAKTDEELESAVSAALLYDPRVASFNVDVDASGYTVTLRGAVDNLQAKRAAEQDARNTVGVYWVKNQIKVRPELALTDEEVANNVKSALARDPFVERYEIRVSVANNTVYLSGDVDSYFEKGRAETVASLAPGVRDVKNYLDVEPGPLAYNPYVDEDYFYLEDWYDHGPFHTLVPDSVIRDEIKDELWWSPFVNESDVKVSVEKGIATLTGTVDSFSEYNAATEEAYEGGAAWVYNKLKVD